MRKVVLAPCSPFSVSEELMRRTARLARAHGVRLHTHLAETADEDEYCLENYGVRPVELMERCEFIGPDVFYAHGIFFNDEELAVLRRRGCAGRALPLVEHAPGLGHLPRARHAGHSASPSRWPWTVLPPTIPRTSWGRCAMPFSSSGWRAGAAPWTRGKCSAWPPRPARRSSDSRASAGSRKGTRRTSPCSTWAAWSTAGSLSDPFAALLFAGYNHGTAYTICNGKVVVDSGRLTGIDEEKLARDANRIASRLLSA